MTSTKNCSIEMLDEAECVGCGVCAYNCNFGAIRVKVNSEGFNSPIVSQKKCTNCGICLNSCPIILRKNINKNLQKTPLTFSAYNKNSKMVEASSSGGVFSALAEVIIKDGGIVFGAAFDNNFELHHIGVQTLDDLQLLRGSKYLQSNMDLIFEQVVEYTNLGRPVLFSGTPCQAASIISLFNGKIPNNLIVCDVVCHGVPSQKTFKAYLNVMKKKYCAKPVKIDFRDKTDSWNKYSICIKFDNDKEYRCEAHQDIYMMGFYKNIFLRKSCYNCLFKQPDFADITLGDFWGIETTSLETNSDKGISVVLANTEKGANFLCRCNELVFEKTGFDTAKKNNLSMYDSVVCHGNRDIVCKKINNYNYNKIVAKYLDEFYEPPLKRLSNGVKLLIKKSIRLDKGI